MIKPKQCLPGNDKQHRSDVILEAQLEDEKGKDVHSFRCVSDCSNGLLLHANVRHVKITEEGDSEELFNDCDKEKETKVH